MCLKPSNGQALSWGPTPHLKKHVIEKEQKKEAGEVGNSTSFPELLAAVPTLGNFGPLCV